MQIHSLNFSTPILHYIYEDGIDTTDMKHNTFRFEFYGGRRFSKAPQRVI